MISKAMPFLSGYLILVNISSVNLNVYILRIQGIVLSMEQVLKLLSLLLVSPVECPYGIFDMVMLSMIRVTYPWTYWRNFKIIILLGLFLKLEFLKCKILL